MNGIRLAVALAAAIVFLQADFSKVAAQGNRGQAYSDAYGRGGMGPGTPAKPTTRTNRGQQNQDQPMSGPPAGLSPDAGRSNSRASNARRSRTRTSSRSNSISTNPLFKYLDSDGNGELSLEEIDAASRLLYSLDENQDDRITSNEVEDMAMSGSDDGHDEEDDRMASQDRNTNRSTTNRSGRTTASRSRTSRGKDTGRAAPMAKAGMMMGLPGAGGSNAPNAGGAAGGGDADDFAANDKNDDGVLKRSEMPRAYRTKFTKMDANKDGEIDENEFYDFIDNQ